MIFDSTLEVASLSWQNEPRFFRPMELQIASNLSDPVVSIPNAYTHCSTECCSKQVQATINDFQAAYVLVSTETTS